MLNGAPVYLSTNVFRTCECIDGDGFGVQLVIVRDGDIPDAQTQVKALPKISVMKVKVSVTPAEEVVVLIGQAPHGNITHLLLIHRLGNGKFWNLGDAEDNQPKPSKPKEIRPLVICNTPPFFLHPLSVHAPAP